MTPFLANAGSALIWAENIHFVVGNVLLGVVEGLLLWGVWKVPLGRAVGRMILANFASFIGGVFAIGIGLNPMLPPDVMLWAFIGSIVALWAVTVAVEWPFIESAFGTEKWQWRRALRASIALQIVSYLLLVPFYMDVGATEVVFGTKHVESSEIGALQGVQVVYASGHRPGLVVGVRAQSGDRWGAIFGDPHDAVPNGDGFHPLTTEGVRATVSEGVVLDRTSDDEAVHVGSEPTARGWRLIGRYGDPNWLIAENTLTGDVVELAVHTPNLLWRSTDATLLPSDVVIYALGPHIVALDLPTRRLATIGLGAHPVVVIEEQTEER